MTATLSEAMRAAVAPLEAAGPVAIDPNRVTIPGYLVMVDQIDYEFYSPDSFTLSVDIFALVSDSEGALDKLGDMVAAAQAAMPELATWRAETRTLVSVRPDPLLAMATRAEFHFNGKANDHG